MAVAVGQVPDDEYKVGLDVFEGPLDLLLYLVRRDEIDVCDVSVERVTCQYMEYLEMMERLDVDVAGEFLVMASTLMLIKSRALLPAGAPGAAGDEDDDDPRLDLVRQLVEYKKFKDAAAGLGGRESRQADCYPPGGAGDGEPGGSGRGGRGPALADVGLDALLAAFRDVRSRAPAMPLGQLRAAAWSVPGKMADILAGARRGGRAGLPFSGLFPPGAPRGEVIVTFLALLELLKRHEVAVRQDEPFAEIYVRGRAAPGAEDDAPVAEDDARVARGGARG